MYLPAQALIHWGPPTSESRDFSRPLGEREGAQGSCSVVLVNTFLGSHFRHSPHTSPVLMPRYTPPPPPQHPLFCGLHNELIVLGVI